jgi:hypothetical protein
LVRVELFAVTVPPTRPKVTVCDAGKFRTERLPVTAEKVTD